MAIPTGALAATLAAVSGRGGREALRIWRSDERFQRVFHWYSDAYLSWFLDSATKVIAPKHKKSRKPPLCCPPQRLWQFSPCNSLLRQYFCREEMDCVFL